MKNINSSYMKGGISRIVRPCVVCSMGLGLFCLQHGAQAQAKAQGILDLVIKDQEKQGVSAAHVRVQQGDDVIQAIADSIGRASLTGLRYGEYMLRVSAVGYAPYEQTIQYPSAAMMVALKKRVTQLDEVVITGGAETRSIKKSLNSVQVFSHAFIERQAASNLFEALGQVNGLTTQLDCSVCYTSSVSIGGVASRHTQYLLNNMPALGSISGVYLGGSFAAPLIDRIEVMRGAGSSRYGTESIGGTIHIITKDPFKAPRMRASYRINSLLQHQVSLLGRVGKNKHSVIAAVNYLHSNFEIDNDRDRIRDVPGQRAINMLTTYSMRRANDRQFVVSLQGLYEDRLGGQLGWTSEQRGSDQLYGESIYTKQAIGLVQYQLPVDVPLYSYTSYTFYDQDAAYGDTFFLAQQQTLFTQFFWEQREKDVERQLRWLVGGDVRATFYDDNTGVTSTSATRQAVLGGDGLSNVLWGAFVEPRLKWGAHTVFMGVRGAYHKLHGFIFSPRVGYTWQVDPYQTFKASLTHGFKIADFFSDAHTEASGSRQLVVQDNLQPEEAYGFYLNYLRQQTLGEHFVDIDVFGGVAGFDRAFQFVYDRDDDKVFYENLDELSWNAHIGLGTSWFFSNGMQVDLGGTYVWNRFRSDGVWQTQYKISPWQGQLVVSTPVVWGVEASWTAQLRSPMRLPVVSNDFRSAQSPWYTLQDLRLSKEFNFGFEIELGAKNLFNAQTDNPILRPEDPFDKTADNAVSNPNGYTFDTEYGYLPQTGRYFYLGVSYEIQ